MMSSPLRIRTPFHIIPLNHKIGKQDQRTYDYLRPVGAFILVEYNVKRGNPWVPYQLSYPSWERINHKVGFTSTQLLANRPSSFLKEIYSSLSANAKVL